MIRKIKLPDGVIPIDEFMKEVRGLTAEEYRNKVKRKGVTHTGNLGTLENDILSGKYDKKLNDHK